MPLHNIGRAHVRLVRGEVGSICIGQRICRKTLREYTQARNRAVSRSHAIRRQAARHHVRFTQQEGWIRSRVAPDSSFIRVEEETKGALRRKLWGDLVGKADSRREVSMVRLH